MAQGSGADPAGELVWEGREEGSQAGREGTAATSQAAGSLGLGGEIPEGRNRQPDSLSFRNLGEASPGRGDDTVTYTLARE